MKKITAFIILLLTLNTGFAEVRQINIQCNPTNFVFDTLKNMFSESIKSVSNYRDFTVTIWENEKKASMSVTITTPDGKETCMLINGENVIKVLGTPVRM